jgi:hypothetical protein
MASCTRGKARSVYVPLEAASVDQNIVPFTQFLAELINNPKIKANLEARR